MAGMLVVGRSVAPIVLVLNRSIFRRHFDVVDDEGVDRALGGFELEAELFCR